jgi:hypothetical protein
MTESGKAEAEMFFAECLLYPIMSSNDISASATAEGMSLQVAGERCCIITTAENRSIRYLFD